MQPVNPTIPMIWLTLILPLALASKSLTQKQSNSIPSEGKITFEEATKGVKPKIAERVLHLIMKEDSKLKDAKEAGLIWGLQEGCPPLGGCQSSKSDKGSARPSS